MKKTKLRFTLTLIIVNLTFSISFAQNIGINGTGNNADPSALLDIDAVATPSLGILIPRIALQAVNLASPVTSPATSLLLYNTATASTGTNAVSPGYYYWDGVQWVRFNTGSLSGGTGWLLNGNAGTTAGTNFVGTTDNVDLVFKRNGVQSGLLNTSLFNTSFGVNALNSSTGGSNTATGYNALNANTTGVANTATGYNALKTNTTGNSNTAVGALALTSNTTGLANTAIGYAALNASRNAYGNTAIGSSALAANTTGYGNSANGEGALNVNLVGINNTANGQNALNNTTGSYNSALGQGAGTSNTTGSNNTFLGYNSDATVGTYTNATAIGYNAKVGANNAMVLGAATGVGTVNVGIGTTTPSNKLHIVTTATNTGFQLQDGTEGANKVLTSDAAGKASWQAPTVASGGGCFPTMISSTSYVTTSYLDAEDYCITLVDGGFSDWRLPTYQELNYLRSTGVSILVANYWTIDANVYPSATYPCLIRIYIPSTASPLQYVDQSGYTLISNFAGSISPKVKCVR